MHDACPAHRLRWPDELLVERRPRRRFRFVPGPPAGRLGDPLRAAGVPPRDGDEYEVAPAQAELQRALARALARGALMVLDYGEAGAGRYERPVPRLRTYVGGVAGGDPLSAPGTQDITVDVDFGAVRAAGEAEGLRTTLDVPQAEWLLAHGRGRGRRGAAASRRRAALARGAERPAGQRCGVPRARAGARSESCSLEWWR